MASKTILHVEDDSDEAFLVRRALERADPGYHVHRVVDGDEAINFLTRSTSNGAPPAYPVPEVMLLDLKLPGKDGFDVLAWAKSREEIKSIPVVVLTSSDRPEDLLRANALGATAYLNKSVSCRNIIEFLEQMDGRSN